MKRLSKTQQKEKEKHSSDLFDAHTALEEAINKYNTTIEAAKGEVEKAANDFNEKLGAARTFCEEIVSEMDGYESERSDKWQESDAASSFQDWKSEWEGISIDDFEPDFPDAMEVPENPQEVFDALPDEVSG